MELDQIFYCFFQVPHEFASQRVQRLFQTGGWQGGIKFLQETKPERKRLVFHSALFQAALVAIGFFVLTSTASFLGKGLVMGACFQLLLEQGKEFRGKGQFNDWFWQFQNVPETRIQVFYFVLMGLVFLLFALFLI